MRNTQRYHICHMTALQSDHGNECKGATLNDLHRVLPMKGKSPTSQISTFANLQGFHHTFSLELRIVSYRGCVGTGRQFERNLISDRSNSGQAAKTRGKRCGRPALHLGPRTAPGHRETAERGRVGQPLHHSAAAGNPREFTRAEKEEQEVAKACNRLIKNSIVCWSHLCLSGRVA